MASPETALLDARDFPSPVVTPLELEVALGLRAWNGNYSTDFSDLLRDAPPPPLAPSSSSSTERASSLGKPDSGAKGASSGNTAGGDGGGGSGANVFQDDQDAPSFSLVTSKLEDSRRLRGKASSQQQQRAEKVSLAFESTENGGNSSGGGGSHHTSRALATYHSPAAEFLASRSYQVGPCLASSLASSLTTDSRSLRRGVCFLFQKACLEFLLLCCQLFFPCAILEIGNMS